MQPDPDKGQSMAEATPSKGRPTDYDPDFARQAEKLCELGATNADLADFFDVSIRTIDRWITKHKDFCRAVKVAKDQADDLVERSLYQRAVGYTFETEKIFNYKGEIVRAQTREHVPPDTTAQIFWLKNRRKAEWRDRVETAVTVGFTDEFESFIKDLRGEKKALAAPVIDGTVNADG